MRITSLPYWLGFAGAAAIACGSEAGSTPSSGSSNSGGAGGAGEACLPGRGCNAGLTCIDGVCRPGTASDAGPGEGEGEGAGGGNGASDGGEGGASAQPTHAPAACHVKTPTLVGPPTTETVVWPMWTGTSHLFVVRAPVAPSGPEHVLRMVRFDKDGIQKASTSLGFDGLPLAAVVHGTTVGLAFADVVTPNLRFGIFDDNAASLATPAFVTNGLADRGVGLVWTGTSYAISWAEVAINANPRVTFVSSTGVASAVSADLEGGYGDNLGPSTLAWTGSELGALWQGAGTPLAFTRVAPDPKMLIEPLGLPPPQGPDNVNPAKSFALAWTGTHYVAAYVTNGGELDLLSISSAGIASNAPLKVDTLDSQALARGIDLVWNGSDLALAWVNTTPSGSTVDVEMQRFDANLVAHGPAKKATTLTPLGGGAGVSGAFSPRLAWSDDEYVVSYEANASVYFVSVCD